MSIKPILSYVNHTEHFFIHLYFFQSLHFASLLPLYVGLDVSMIKPLITLIKLDTGRILGKEVKFAKLKIE